MKICYLVLCCTLMFASTTNGYEIFSELQNCMSHVGLNNEWPQESVPNEDALLAATNLKHIMSGLLDGTQPSLHGQHGYVVDGDFQTQLQGSQTFNEFQKFVYWNSFACSACVVALQDCTQIDSRSMHTVETLTVEEVVNGQTQQVQRMNLVNRFLEYLATDIQEIEQKLDLLYEDAESISERPMLPAVKQEKINGLAQDSKLPFVYHCETLGCIKSIRDYIQFVMRIMYFKDQAKRSRICGGYLASTTDSELGRDFLVRSPLRKRRTELFDSNSMSWHDAVDSSLFVARRYAIADACPEMKYQWSLEFTPKLEAQEGLTNFGGEKVRMLFQPHLPHHPWQFQRSSRRGKNWDNFVMNSATSVDRSQVPEVDSDDEELDSTPTSNNRAAVDAFSIALAGLEFWSAKQGTFSNIMVAWMVIIARRRGLFSERLKNMLGILKGLGSTNDIIQLKTAEGVEEIEGVIEHVDFGVSQLNSTIAGAIDGAFYWAHMADSSTSVAISNQVSTALNGLGLGFASLASAILLWNAVFVDKTTAERLYSTIQGGLVWADVFIHVGLAIATQGISVPIIATLGIVSVTMELFEKLKKTEWFKRNFSTLARLTGEDLAKLEYARRHQICFAAFYSAVAVAENTARDIFSLRSNAERFERALSFDAPNTQSLNARKTSIVQLFNDLLFTLIPRVDSTVHNIPNSGFLTICDTTVQGTATTKYFSVAKSSWSDYLRNVDVTNYQTCKEENQASISMYRTMRGSGRKIAERTPCSPSELVLAVYHWALKHDPKLPRKHNIRFKDLIDAVVSPASKFASSFRETILSKINGHLPMNVKLFSEQDLGILNVWFTLNLFHGASYHEMDTVTAEAMRRHGKKTKWLSSNTKTTTINGCWTR